jgi:hypothetical protein
VMTLVPSCRMFSSEGCLIDYRYTSLAEEVQILSDYIRSSAIDQCQ